LPEGRGFIVEGRMRKVVVAEFMSLDGVVQSPMYPDEDPSNGFVHGGWNMRFMDADAMRWTVDNVVGADGYLYGRRTYEQFARHWPHATQEEQVLAKPLNERAKYVASRARPQLEWQRSELLPMDVAAGVAALKNREGGYLMMTGSTELARTLLQAGLVDELRLMIDPILLGGGKRIFPDDRAMRAWELSSSKATSTGAMLATYVRRE
jgi:dihydrofolate reductase